MNDATACIVEQNDFLACQTGINLWRWCRQPGLNEKNIIQGNQFDQTKGNAIQTAPGTAGNRILGNEITASGKNGVILNGEGQVVKANRISGSGLKDLTIGSGRHDISP